MASSKTGKVPARFKVGDQVRVKDLPNLFYTRTRCLSAASAVLSLSVPMKI